MITLTNYEMNQMSAYQIVPYLPTSLKNKIYITWMREFWKEYVPLTAKIPSWYPRRIATEKEIYDSRHKNIHFLHLPFNTLRENKRWIIGCQCQDCLSEDLLSNEEKEFFYKIQYLYWTVYNLDIIENWTLTENFNPLYNTKYDTSVTKNINGLQIDFK
jgi:hypothetical protein